MLRWYGVDGKLRGNDRHGQRAFRTDTVTTRDLGNHRQYRIGNVPGTGEDGEDIGDGRRHEGDVFRVLAQQFGGCLDHQVQTAGGLHRGRRRNHRHHHQHNVNRRAGRLQTKTKRQNGETQTTEYTKPDTARLRAEQNTDQHDDELYEE